MSKHRTKNESPDTQFFIRQNDVLAYGRGQRVEIFTEDGENRVPVMICKKQTRRKEKGKLMLK